MPNGGQSVFVESPEHRETPAKVGGPSLGIWFLRLTVHPVELGALEGVDPLNNRTHDFIVPFLLSLSAFRAACGLLYFARQPPHWFAWRFRGFARLLRQFGSEREVP